MKEHCRILFALNQTIIIPSFIVNQPGDWIYEGISREIEEVGSTESLVSNFEFLVLLFSVPTHHPPKW